MTNDEIALVLENFARATNILAARKLVAGEITPRSAAEFGNTAGMVFALADCFRKAVKPSGIIKP